MASVSSGDDDDTTTPVDLDARRPETPGGRAWIGLERALTRAVDRVRTNRVSFSEASPSHQAAMAWDIAGAIRELGDAAHELAGQVEDFARRAAKLDDPATPGVGSST